MSSVTRSIGSWLRVGAVLAAAFMTAPALAQPTTQEVADIASARIAKVSTDASNGLADQAQSAIVVVKRLARQGASNSTIFHFFLETKGELSTIATNANGLINSIAQTAVVRLAGMGATQAQIDQVLTSSDVGRQQLWISHDLALRRVKAAVDAAMRGG